MKKNLIGKVVTLVNENTYTFNGNEWFVIATDKMFSYWGMAENKCVKRVYICQSKADAMTLKDRINSKPYEKLRYVNINNEIPYYNSNKFMVQFDVFTDRLFNY